MYRFSDQPPTMNLCISVVCTNISVLSEPPRGWIIQTNKAIIIVTPTLLPTTITMLTMCDVVTSLLPRSNRNYIVLLFWSHDLVFLVWFRLFLTDLTQFLGNISRPLPPFIPTTLLPDQCYGGHVICHTTDVCHVLTERSSRSRWFRTDWLK